MATQGFTPESLRQLERKLNRLPEAIAKKALRSAVTKGATVIRKEAQSRAPKRTGKLAENIIQRTKIKSLGVKGAEIVIRIGLRLRPKQKSVFYGLFQEFGYLAKLRDGTVKQVPAQPFMRPAFESKKEAALHTIIDRLKRRIEKLAVRA